jgi:parallel beta-helix repeat protein
MTMVIRTAREVLANFLRLRSRARWLPILVVTLASAYVQDYAWGQAFTVDCGNSAPPNTPLQTAINNFAAGGPVTIEVLGVCDPVVIGVPNVTLLTGNVPSAASPATIQSLNPSKPAVVVAAGGTTINGFVITGNQAPGGILVTTGGGLTLQNCNVHDISGPGIIFQHSSSGTIDHCTVQQNGKFGLTVQQSSGVTITNSQFTNNEVGIHVFGGGSARIGINDAGQLAGNNITGNKASGIFIDIGGTSFIGGNTISSNGFSSTGIFGRAGVEIFGGGTADLAGANTISGNAAFGIDVEVSSVLVGDPSASFSTVNSITGNGVDSSISTVNKGGINVFLNSQLLLFDASVSNNTGAGLKAALRSVVSSTKTTINNNSGDGVHLIEGSALLLNDPAVSITTNGGFGINCADHASNVAGDLSGVSANGRANISHECRAF